MAGFDRLNRLVPQPLPVEMEEEKQDQPFQIQDPKVKDYMSKLYGDKYSDEARSDLVSQVEEEGSGPNFLGALAALGAGLQGGNAAEAGMNFVRNQEAGRQKKLTQFDEGRNQLLAKSKTEREFRDDAQKQERLIAEKDPNSDASKIAQGLALEMGMNPEVASKLTAEQWNVQGPLFQKKYEVAQSKIEKDLARQDRELARNQAREDRLLAREDRLATRAEGATKRAFENLPEEHKQTISGLAKKNVDKEAIANSIDSVMSNWDGWDENTQLQQGRQLIKVLNSTQGSDAVGAEEAKRLAGKLEFALGNMTNDNPVQFGRDLKGFRDDAVLTSKSMRDAITANNKVINKAYGRDTQVTSSEPKMATTPEQVSSAKISVDKDGVAWERGENGKWKRSTQTANAGRR